MADIRLSNALRAEYQHLFDSCQVDTRQAAAVERLVRALAGDRTVYADVGDPLGIPWYVVGVIHVMEAARRFDRHLHNGDPLTARTRQVPAGRPRSGEPPFTWAASATDALTLHGFGRWSDWSVPGTLYQLERYNGWGYRKFHPHVLSPYLWSGSNHYTRGKYVADGRWSDSAVSAQLGAAVMLRRLLETGTVHASAELPPSPTVAAPPRDRPLLRYSEREVAYAAELQTFLNRLPNIYLKVDGKPGRRTSDAFKAVTGHYLDGDPQA